MGTTTYTRAKIYKIGSVYARVIRPAVCDDFAYTRRALSFFQPYIQTADRYTRTIQKWHKYLNGLIEGENAKIAKLEEEQKKNKDNTALCEELDAKIKAIEASVAAEQEKVQKEIREYEDEEVTIAALPSEEEFSAFIAEKKVYKLSAGDLYDLFVFDKHISETDQK